MLRENFSIVLDNNKKSKINTKYDNYFNLFNKICDMPNFILFGPPGVGKYSESLKIIEQFSESNLKYEKKMLIKSAKNEHIIKISDIHFEINMENLTCNSKILFNDIYINIIDAIEGSKNKCGIILCKNFHSINNEILDIFYSYMQQNLINSKVLVKFIILTEAISFIPKNILDVSKILYYSKLSYSSYIKLSNSNNKKFFNKLRNASTISTDNAEHESSMIIKNKNYYANQIDNLHVLRHIDLNNNYNDIINLKYSICEQLISLIDNNIINYANIRNILYDILIHNLSVYECIYYITTSCVKNNILKSSANSANNANSANKIDKIFTKMCKFFKYYNNNYRPIYHLEYYILSLISILDESL